MQSSQQPNQPAPHTRASTSRRLKAAVIFLAISALFGFFHLAAAGRIDPDRWLTPCGFKQKYNLPCPTCQMTSAAILFVQGKVLQAFSIQPAGALLCLALAVTAVFAFFIAFFGVYFRFLDRFFAEIKIKHIILIVVIIILAGWVVTVIQSLMTG